MVAAPVFRKVLKKILPFLRKSRTFIPKKGKALDWDVNIQKGTMPNLQGMSKKQVLFLLHKYFPGDHILEGTGYVKKQIPEAGSKIQPPYKFLLKFSFP
ncbi:MAG: PASTA domain-containing protein [Candidatus Hydrogenedentota bacterium]|nr:MAG: PASTA domain-containing protein [Candidatus Hydrogenedentota bacterium]